MNRLAEDESAHSIRSYQSGAALTTISFADFLLATILGKIPSMVFETFVGHDLVYLSENKYRLIFSLLAGSLVFQLFWGKEKKRSQRS